MRIRRAVHGDVPGIYRCLSQMVTHLPTPESHNLIADSYFKQDWVYSVSTRLVVLSDPVSVCVGEVANDDWTVL